jgi:hypothetical protein
MREGRQNIRIWVASMLIGVSQTSAQNGSVRAAPDVGRLHSATGIVPRQ